MGYFEIFLLIHIAGAIIGFGPTFAFAVLGPLSGKLQGPQSLGILHGMVAIERRLVIPVATVVQPLTGVLLIFESGRNNNFFQHEWLWISILLYIGLYYTAVFLQTPTIDRIIEMAEGGKAGTPEFQEQVKRTQTFGPMLSVGLVIIIFLMITKPGSPDGFF